MKIIRLLLIVTAISAIACVAKKAASSHSTSGKWVPLFNGKNIDNWIPKIAGYPLGTNFGNTFRVENGILSTRYDQYDSFRSHFGALYYDKKFTNFRLKVDYRFAGPLTLGAPTWGFRDGGIQYYCQPPATVALDQPFPVCLEYNILGYKDTGERPTGEICASGMSVLINGKRNTSYCTPPEVKKAYSGDEWVTAEIEVRDGKITHYVNGTPVISFTDPRYDTANALVKKLHIAATELVKEGYISLQSNSHPMDFRNIAIMEY